MSLAEVFELREAIRQEGLIQAYLLHLTRPPDPDAAPSKPKPPKFKSALEVMAYFKSPEMFGDRIQPWVSKSPE